MMRKIHLPLRGLLRSIILALAISLALFVGAPPSDRISNAGGTDKAMQTDGPTFGNDPGGQRYAPLTQINADNVAKLVRAWTYHMKPAGAAPPGAESVPPACGPRRRSNPESQAVPLVVNGVMYLTTAYRRVVALEPETGKCVWEYEIKRGEAATRGLEYWAGDAESRPPIGPRLFFGTSNGELIALDARTGQPATSFGAGGVVDMKDGLIQATPIGMLGHPGSPLPIELLRPPHWVAEIIYFPLETELLKSARLLGCRTLDGAGMVVFQAAEAFRLFTGVAPDYERMLRCFAGLN